MIVEPGVFLFYIDLPECFAVSKWQVIHPLYEALHPAYKIFVNFFVFLIVLLDPEFFILDPRTSGR